MSPSTVFSPSISSMSRPVANVPFDWPMPGLRFRSLWDGLSRHLSCLLPLMAFLLQSHCQCGRRRAVPLVSAAPDRGPYSMPLHHRSTCPRPRSIQPEKRPMNELLTQAQNDFAQAVLAGLSQPQKVVPARFLYDKRGSELFEQITRLPDYYLTRTETALLEQHAADIAALAGDETVVVEFGSGSAAKTPLLLAAVCPAIYIPVDISADFLAEAAKGMEQSHPGLRVVPIAGDFTLPVYLDSIAGETRRLGFFPGGTIGNFG